MGSGNETTCERVGSGNVTMCERVGSCLGMRQLKPHLHDEKVASPIGLPLTVSLKVTLPVRESCGEIQTTLNLLTNTPVTVTPSNEHTMLSC